MQYFIHLAGTRQVRIFSFQGHKTVAQARGLCHLLFKQAAFYASKSTGGTPVPLFFQNFSDQMTAIPDLTGGRPPAALGWLCSAASSRQ
jgi:hypothetical protein